MNKWLLDLHSDRAHRAKDMITRVGGTVAVVGSLNADLTVVAERLPFPGETVHGQALKILPGGKSSNQAAACGRLGAKTSLIGAVGPDPNGEMVLGALRSSNVCVDCVYISSVVTGTAMITVDGAGENTIVISPGANGTLSAHHVAKAKHVIRDADVLGLCLEVPIEANLEAAKIAKESNTLVVFNLSPAGEVPDELLKLVDVLIVNEHEFNFLMESDVDLSEAGELPAECVHRIRNLGIGTVVVTMGAQGASIIEGSKINSVPALRVDVVDTTGCGDAFMGAFMTALASGMSFSEAAELATFISSVAATKQGAQSSYVGKEIAEYL